jgi:hypothetical protein
MQTALAETMFQIERDIVQTKDTAARIDDRLPKFDEEKER